MRRVILLTLLLTTLLLSTSCATNKEAELLNPSKPITVTLWHYYNGNTKEAFDRLVNEFNETLGIEKGIVVDAQSQGDVIQLATAVFEAANQSIGAAPMPDIFASYADNAFRVHEMVGLVSLDTYFSESELGAYRDEFLEEGRFITDDKFYIVPVAKSSENLYVNKNHWETFAEESGFTEADLSTWEGINKVAKTYYEKTGKGFFGVDANANYILTASMQLGHELYLYSDAGTVTFNFKPEIAKLIWDHFYTPYIKGYFAKSGRFSSDDAKTGAVIAYTGSTAGAAYFPTAVALSEQESVEIEPLIMPYPHFEVGKPVAIQQGAGMCISKSDEAHEYAAALFLKWFTEIDQNIEFAVSTGYFPVLDDALDQTLMLEQVATGNVGSQAIVESIKATDHMFKNYELYNNKPFQGSFEMRTLLDTQLINKIGHDLEMMTTKIAAGENRDSLIMELTSDEAFERWYEELLNEASLILD